jgi:uracil phosphoribosyltransferase
VRLVQITHPLAADRLTRMRDRTAGNAAFRLALDDLSRMLVYEAARELPMAPLTVQTPLAATDGVAIDVQPLVVPVLRAGLGMLPAALSLMPSTQVGFIGMARDETTYEPHAYLESLPEDVAGRPVFLLDPMLATGGSLLRACRLVFDRGARKLTVVCVLAAPEGLATLEESGLDLTVVTAAVDEHLDESAFIVPGLGDAGDRQFGPR